MDPKLIEKFMEVTGEGEAAATSWLQLTDGNVENAISLMFEGGGIAPTSSQVQIDEPEIRAPILPTQEVLIPSEPVCSFSRGTASNGVFDRFRDFAVEIQRQEEELTRRVSGGNNNKSNHCKTKRLEDLFRPPYEILFMGSFVEARDHAKTVNRWLLVNVQNPQEFSCQILNRDVWANKQIKEIIKDHFVLWQVLSNTSDGKRYIDFYNVNDYPYLAVVDPRTGECIKSYNSITIDTLLTSLNDMLSVNPSPDSTSDSPRVEESHCEPSSSAKRTSRPDSMSKDSGKRIKKSRNADTATSSIASSSRGIAGISAVSTSTGVSIIRGKRSRIEMNDDVPEVSHSNEAAVPTEQSSSSVVETVTSKSNPTSANGETSLRLCLRLPSGGKENISMCPSDTVEDFVKRMEDMGYSSADHTYLVPFPKTNVGTLPSKTQLADTILYPSNTVFITKV